MTASRQNRKHGNSPTAQAGYEAFQHCPDGIALVDPATQEIRTCNPAFARLTGRPIGEIPGTTLLALHPPDAAARIGLALQRLATTETTGYDAPLHRPNAAPLKVGVRIAGIRDAAGATNQWVITVQDISERSEALEERSRLLFDSSPQPKWIYDIRTLEFLEVNQAAIRRYGYSREEFLAMTLRDIRPESEIPRLHQQVVEPRDTQCVSGPWRHRCKDGREILVEIHASDIGLGPRPTRIAMATDITERVRGEELRRESEERFRRFFHANPVAITLMRESDGLVEDVNEAGERLFGYTRDEIIEHSTVELGLWLDVESRNRVIADVLRRGSLRDAELGFRRKSGETGTLLVSAEVIIIRGRTLVLALLNDITERKQSERFMQVQHDLARALAATTDLREGLERCLEAAIAIGGMEAGGIYLRDEQTGELTLAVHRGLCDAFVAAAGRYSAATPQAQAVAAGRPVYLYAGPDEQLVPEPGRRDGMRGIAILPLATDNQVLGSLNVASRTQDAIPPSTRRALETLAAEAAQAISRLQAGAKLRAEQHRLNSIIEGTGAGTWEWDVQTGETVFNEAWARMLGYTLEELGPTTFKTWARLAHPDDVNRTAAILPKHFSGEVPYYENTCRLRHKDGHWVWVLDRGRLVSHTLDGKPWKMLGAHTDITAQKNSELALRESEARFRLAVDAAQMGVFDWDMVTGRVVWAGRSEEMWGYAPGEFDGTYGGFTRRVHPDDVPGIERVLREIMVSRQPFSHEFRVVWPDGTVRWLFSSGRISFSEAGVPVRLQGVTMDVTARRQAAIEIERQGGLIRALLDSVPDLIFYKDCAGTYLGCNPAFAEMVGRRREEIVGRTDYDLFPREVADEFRAHDRLMFAELRPRHNEEWVTYPGGRKALLETLKTPYRGPDGQLLGVLGVSRDITLRKRESLVQQARARLLEFAAEHTLEELLVHTLDEAEVLTGSRIGFYHFLEPDQVTLSLQAWSTRTTREMCRAEGKGQHYNVDSAGVWVDCIREGRPVVHNDYAALNHRRGLPPGHAAVERELVVPVQRQGLIVSILGVGNKPGNYTDDDMAVVAQLADFAWDIVERKRAEVALSDNAARLRLALVAANQGLFDLNLLTGHAMVSPEYATMLGYDPDTFAETTPLWIERLHPDDREPTRRTLEDYVAGRAADYRLEFRQRTSTGEWKWILSVGRIVEWAEDGRPSRMLGTHTDITEAKRADEALRSSEERHRQLVETSADWIWEIDAAGRYTYASPRLKEMLGYEPAEILGRSVFDLMPAQEVNRLRQHVLDTVAARQPFVALENINQHKDGRLVTVETSGVPVFDARGEFAGYRGMDRDITARRSAERQMRLHGAALSAAANAVLITDREGLVEWANPAFTALSGWQLSEVLGRSPRELIGSGQHGPEFFRRMWETISAGRVWQGEIINRRKDGALRTEEMTITPLTDERGAITHYIAVKQDITDRKLLETQNRQAQRMEALGAMAGGIAHDLNNILSPIMMVAGLLSDSVTEEKDRAMLEMLQQGAKRGAAIIQQLLTFSRGMEGERLPVELRYVVKEVMAMMRETFPREINLVLDLPKVLPLVSADVTQMHQLVLNLCVNARDAMPDGGHLTLAMRVQTLAAGDTRLPADVTPGEFVVLLVTDSGHGIPPAILDRIFDPFFTTKPLGKGTGLGLATVQGIVRSHGGFISVDSVVGSGTTFKVHLPSTGLEAAGSAPAAPAPAAKGGGETILVVDDERDIREATRMALETRGYRVRLAVNGQDAVGQFRAHRAEIALVFTDVMMPVMNGVALVQALRELDRTIPVLVTTGLSEINQQRELASLGVKEILPKPCDTATLLAAVQAHLAVRRAGSGET